MHAAHLADSGRASAGAVAPAAAEAPLHRRLLLVFAAAMVLLVPGLALYHLTPSTWTLVADRLPMATGFVSVWTAWALRWVDPGKLACVLPWGVAAACGSVLLAAWPSTASGAAAGMSWSSLALVPYGLLQYGLILALLVTLPQLHARMPVLLALGLYVVAKVFELLDHAAAIVTWLSTQAMGNRAHATTPTTAALANVGWPAGQAAPAAPVAAVAR
jgi:hypothetical protein